MSDLTNLEKHKLEKLLNMSSGYVLNFTNRSFQEFVADSTGRDIYDPRYGSGSKANQLRSFWRQEANRVVGKLMGDMLEYGVEMHLVIHNTQAFQEFRRIVSRLMESSAVPEIDALSGNLR